jgi:hypothetical protein
MSSHDAVLRIADELPDWLPIVEGCLKEERQTQGSGFCGRWVLNDLTGDNWTGLTYRTTRVQSFPGLSTLVRRGILQHRSSMPTTRGGRRAYYTMPDPEGVEKALRELGRR